MHRLLTTLLLATLVACAESQFQGGNGRRPAAKPSGQGAQDATGGDGGASSTNSSGDNAGANGGNGTNANSDEVFGGDGTATLPTNCNDQNVLILDFKSGWWEGDGGNTFRELILDEIKTHACPGSNAGVEYHHIIKPAPARFYNVEFKTYSQVWILSGSLADLADIPLNEPGFLDVLQQIETNKPRLFLGAGFGSVDHVNAVANKIWSADAFNTDNKTGSILLIDADGANVTVKTHTTAKVNGNLFQGVTGPIVDHVDVGGMYAGSDELRSGLAGMTVLADCTTPPFIPATDPFSQPKSVPSRTVACIGVGQANGYKIITDSGIQRFYGLYKGEEPTKVYLRNIFRALSL